MRSLIGKFLMWLGNALERFGYLTYLKGWETLKDEDRRKHIEEKYESE